MKDAASVRLVGIDERRGSIHELAGSAETIVVVFMSAQCPYARAYFGDLDELALRFPRASLILVNSCAGSDDDPEDLDTMRARAGVLHVPFLRDSEGRVARAFKASHTPHCFLLDRAFEILYDGAIDDRYLPPEQWSEGAQGRWPWDDAPAPPPQQRFLGDGLAAVFEKRDQPRRSTAPVGCALRLALAAT